MAPQHRREAPAQPPAPSGPDRFLLVRLYRAAKWATLLAAVLIAATLVAGRYLPEPGLPWIWQDPDRTLSPQPAVDWSEVDGAIREVLADARGRARERAEQRLNAWHAELMTRVEEDFLPWYFAFWGQQWRDLKTAGYLVGDWSGWMDAERAVREDFRDAFAARVMPPGETQLRMEAIAREALTVYLDRARRELPEIPREYRIPREDWQQHLAQIGLQLRRSEAQTEAVPTTLKGLVAFGTAGTTAAVLRGSQALHRVGVAAGSWAPRATAGATGTALAGRTGLRLGGRFLGATALAALVAWDVYDHHHREAELRPRLRERLGAYLDGLRNRMLDDGTHGVLAPVHELEARIQPQLVGSDDPSGLAR